MLLIIEIIVVAILVAALLAEIRRDLMMLQQNSYRADRYRKWLDTSGDTTSLSRLTAMAVFLGVLVPFVPRTFSIALLGIEGSAILLGHLTRHYKKPLVFTPRAIRIFAADILLSSIVVGGSIALAVNLSYPDLLWVAIEALLLCFILSHLIILLANKLLDPIQNAINRRYYNEAASILASMPSMKVIGITGSYGKTSTKHYLYRILSEEFETVMTPGSFNTTLGVVRTIREYLQPYTQIFIAEMGAKQLGDIKEICDLVHPSIGIVTAVGEQHLESFKSIENVQRTKFELIDSLPADGFAVINNDFEYIASREVHNVATVRYGIKSSMSNGVAATATQIVVKSTGTEFTLNWDKYNHKFRTRLIGECNISNLIAAIVVALQLGMKPESIERAVAQIEQVEHRLNVKRSGSITLIDDAFNSNPVGSAMALDVLRLMEGNRKIIITPGMIELGMRQFEANKEFGKKIAECADIALIVGNYNNEPIIEGISERSDSKIEVKEFATFSQAQAYYQSIAVSGDVVLYENDLPDTFK